MKAKVSHRREMERLRREYARELPGKVEALRAAAAAAEAWDPVGLTELYHLVHRLSGSAAIYGMAAVSRAAADLEAFLLPALAGGSAPREPGPLRALVDTLSRAAEPARRPGRKGPAVRLTRPRRAPSGTR